MQRDFSRCLGRRQLRLSRTAPIISFSFDDFPTTALINGGSILRKFGATGTFYASFGLMGMDSPVGQIFEAGDLGDLLDAGHELGCHTFDHCHSWDTKPREFEQSVLRNAAAVKQFLPGHAFKTLSYPLASPRPGTKRLMSRYFQCCRGGGQTFNQEVTDLNSLKAYFIEQSLHDPAAIRKVIDQCAANCGWLVFATHDVTPNHSRFGCSPEFFTGVVEYASKSGALLLPLGKAFQMQTSAHI